MAATSDLLVVLDGATVRTETGCLHGAAWYARKLGAALISAAASSVTPLDKALALAIQDVANLHPECNLDHPGTPSAGVAVLREEADQMLSYLVLGDVTIVADTTEGLVVVSDDRVSQTAARERAETDKHLIGSPNKAAALVEMKHAELAARNTPGGYWIAAADPTVVEHAIQGAIKSQSLRRLAVLSDGAARAVTLFRTRTWASMLDMIAVDGPNALIGEIRAMENQDPLGADHPRNKKSDDATVVYTGAAEASAPNVITNPTPEQRAWALENARKNPLFISASMPGALMGEVRQPGWKPRWRYAE